jgi:hypothetical protein
MWKFPTPPEPEKVKSQPPKSLDLLENTLPKVLDTKERKDKEDKPVSLSPSKAEDTDEWLTHEQAVKLGLTPGSRLYKQATGS